MDGYVEFLLRQHREQDAFETADRNRLRELVDSPTARWPLPADGAFLPWIQASLPLRTALIEYRVLRRNIIVWVVTPDGFATITLPVSIDDLKPALAVFNAQAQEAELRTSASFLYDSLLRGVAPLLKDSPVLVIVPDDELERVPYSVLYDKSRGQYLLETRVTVVAPSAALFVQSSVRSRARATTDERMVVVQATSGDATFAALPEGAAEAQSIARLYPNRRIIDGSTESGPELLKQTKNASLLQFVGHTTVERDHLLKTLRLGGAEKSRLSMADILAAELPRLRLAYLSACETDSGPILKSEGSVTIARSFFAAGVPVVIGTLWPVRDETARSAALTFHEHLRRGDTPSESLRQAQLSLLTHNRPATADWAAFRIIGAGI
jgi:CHAT domain-containing protein